jgi:hypothetical protein
VTFHTVCFPLQLFSLQGHLGLRNRSAAEMGQTWGERGRHGCHGLINYIDTKAKCCHLENWPWPVKGLCCRCLAVWGPLPSYDTRPPLSYCIRVYCVLIHTGKGGGEELTREKVIEGQQFTKLYHLSINSEKHLRKVTLPVNFLDDEF